MEKCGLYFEWLTDASPVDALVQLFMAGSQSNYITSGELQEERAVAPATWSPDLPDILRAEFEAVIRNPLYQGANAALVYSDDRVAGYALIEYSKDGKYATLSDIVIHPDEQNMRLGRQLAHWVLDQLKAAGIREVYAESNIHNEGAHDFLHRLGFETISKVFHLSLVKALPVARSLKGRRHDSAYPF